MDKWTERQRGVYINGLYQQICWEYAPVSWDLLCFLCLSLTRAHTQNINYAHAHTQTHTSAQDLWEVLYLLL